MTIAEADPVELLYHPLFFWYRMNQCALLLYSTKKRKMIELGTIMDADLRVACVYCCIQTYILSYMRPCRHSGYVGNFWRLAWLCFARIYFHHLLFDC